MKITMNIWDEEGNAIHVYGFEVPDDTFELLQKQDGQTIRDLLKLVYERDTGEEVDDLYKNDDQIVLCHGNGEYSAVIVTRGFYTGIMVVHNILIGDKPPEFKG